MQVIIAKDHRKAGVQAISIARMARSYSSLMQERAMRAINIFVPTKNA